MSGHRTARILIYTHRWLGIAIGFLFITWFLSGIVMMYASLPALDPLERLARLPAINPATIRIDPPRLDGEIARFTIGSLEGRPIYRMTSGGQTRLVFADTGDEVPPVDAGQALRIARAFVGSGSVRYDARLSDADQWTWRAVDGSVELEPRHRSHARPAAAARRRPNRRRRFVSRPHSPCARSVPAAHGERDRAGAVPRSLLRERG